MVSNEMGEAFMAANFLLYWYQVHLLAVWWRLVRGMEIRYPFVLGFTYFSVLCLTEYVLLYINRTETSDKPETREQHLEVFDCMS